MVAELLRRRLPTSLDAAFPSVSSDRNGYSAIEFAMNALDATLPAGWRTEIPGPWMPPKRADWCERLSESERNSLRSQLGSFREAFDLLVDASMSERVSSPHFFGDDGAERALASMDVVVGAGYVLEAFAVFGDDAERVKAIEALVRLSFRYERRTTMDCVVPRLLSEAASRSIRRVPREAARSGTVRLAALGEEILGSRPVVPDAQVILGAALECLATAVDAEATDQDGAATARRLNAWRARWIAAQAMFRERDLTDESLGDLLMAAGVAESDRRAVRADVRRVRSTFDALDVAVVSVHAGKLLNSRHAEHAHELTDELRRISDRVAVAVHDGELILRSIDDDRVDESQVLAGRVWRVALEAE